jgi:uncharacterized protein YoxC
MFTDICIGAISLAFVVLVVYLIITLHRILGTLKQTKRTLLHVDHLAKTTDEVALDLKEKLKALNFFFRPLEKLNKKKTPHRSENIADIVQFAAEGISLFNNLKKKKG